MTKMVDENALFDQAWAARERSYSPYSKFAVGAALLGPSGKMYHGCNVENISFGLTICAERAAALAAIQAGERAFTAIAIVAETDLPIVPCGSCRQFLAEFNPSLQIFSEGKDHARREFSLATLLPNPRDGILNSGG